VEGNLTPRCSLALLREMTCAAVATRFISFQTHFWSDSDF